MEIRGKECVFNDTSAQLKLRLFYFPSNLAFEREGRKEGNVLFNDALNTFHLRLYGVRHGKGPFR